MSVKLWIVMENIDHFTRLAILDIVKSFPENYDVEECDLLNVPKDERIIIFRYGTQAFGQCFHLAGKQNTTVINIWPKGISAKDTNSFSVTDDINTIMISIRRNIRSGRFNHRCKHCSVLSLLSSQEIRYVFNHYINHNPLRDYPNIKKRSLMKASIMKKLDLDNNVIFHKVILELNHLI